MTQAQEIKQFMEEHGGITNAESVEYLHCYRLAARIHDLRKAGVEIESRTEYGFREDGKAYHYSRYFLR